MANTGVVNVSTVAGNKITKTVSKTTTTQLSVQNNSSCSKRAPLIFLHTQSRELSAFARRPMPYKSHRKFYHQNDKH